MFDMSATQRLNNMGPSTEPCGTQYLAAKNDEQPESVCRIRHKLFYV